MAEDVHGTNQDFLLFILARREILLDSILKVEFNKPLIYCQDGRLTEIDSDKTNEIKIEGFTRMVGYFNGCSEYSLRLNSFRPNNTHFTSVPLQYIKSVEVVSEKTGLQKIIES